MPIHPQNWNFPNDFTTEVCVGHIASTTWEKNIQRRQKFFTVFTVVSIPPSPLDPDDPIRQIWREERPREREGR